MSYQNPFGGIPLLKIGTEDEHKGKQNRGLKLKELAAKYFIDSDEDEKQNAEIKIKESSRPALNMHSLFRNFEGADDDKKRALIHLESMLDQEKIKAKDHQDVYHQRISQLEVEKSKLDRDLNEHKSKHTVAKGKVKSLQELFNAQKSENELLKEERSELKNHHMEEVSRLKEDTEKKNKTLETLRNDLIGSKNDAIRFETSLRNKDIEMQRLQALLDREKEKEKLYAESRDKEARELRKQINYESDRHIKGTPQ